MKKLLSILTLCMGLCCVSCYDDSALVERIDALEQSTIASLKASISSLESQSGDIKSSIASLEQSGNANATEIAALKTSLGTIETKIEELKSWVEKLLKGYYTKEEIDAQIQTLNTEIETLRTKISSIESKLDILMREFVISFDDTEIGILGGGTTSVGYIITGATEKTTVKALGQNGWSAKVTPDGTDKGTITVTAPDPLTEDEIIVLVYDGEFRTIMSSINFVTGVVTPSQTAVELDAEAGTVDITVTSNLNYKVSIPEEAKDWLSVVETKATKTETITFAYTECVGSIRKAIVAFIDEANNTISNMTFVQQGSAVEVTLTEAGALLSAIGEDVYLNLKGITINGPINGDDFTILSRMSQLKYVNMSNAYIVEGGVGSYKTRANIYDAKAFTYHKTLEEIHFPSGIESIGYMAVSCTPKVKKIVLPDGLKTIGTAAFSSNSSLTDINIPESVTSIETEAFGGCWKLTNITLPSNTTRIEQWTYRGTGIKQINLPETLNFIGSESFSGTPLESITIPKNVTTIGMGAFSSCSELKEIHIKGVPTILTSISNNSFGCSSSDTAIYDNATLYIPKGTKEAYYLTDLGRFKNIVEE